MMLWAVALFFGLGSCAIALTMTVINLRLYRTPAAGIGAVEEAAGDVARVSVCIPARNEEANIEACVRSLLANRGIGFEVLVYDDQSTDGTGAIVSRLLKEDSRVRRVETVPLPAGWNGKQHACWRMAQASRGAWMLFTDADVRFSPDCVERALSQCEGSKGSVAMWSTFPRQITGTLGEALVVPMIFFVLFGYLPFARMRSTMDPAASAGCGQFLLVEREAYFASGGHEAFRGSMHDGIMLPRVMRRAGFRTDLFDGSGLCSCRMYRGFVQTWRGFAKNAYEGLGSVGLLVFITVAHLCGHVLPWGYLVGAGLGAWDWRWGGVALTCIGCALVQRGLLAWRFSQPWAGVVLHPVAVVLMTAIQWHSLILAKTGRRAWKGRGG